MVHDDHLAVVADEGVTGARDENALLEKPELELAQPLLALRPLMRDQRPDDDAALARGYELLLHLLEIEPEDHQVERLLGRPNGLQQRLDSVVGLNDKLHASTSAVRHARLSMG